MKRSSHSNAPYYAMDFHYEFLHHKVHRDKLKSGTDGTVLQLRHHHKLSISVMKTKILANVSLLCYVTGKSGTLAI